MKRRRPFEPKTISRVTSGTCIEITMGEILRAFQWVFRASEKSNTNHQGYKSVLVEDDTLVSTDGHRLHWYQSELVKDAGIPSGLYRIVTLSPTIVGIASSEPFPNWKKVVPKEEELDTLCKNELYLPWMIQEIGKAGFAVNPDFMKDMFTKLSGWTIMGKEGRPILFRCSPYNAIIMPMIR